MTRVPDTPRLPDTVAPMLAEKAEPFDSDEHVFEIKWDGIRVVAFVEDGGYRLQNRKLNDCTHQYPELDGIGALPAGTVLDGEIVILIDDVPDFQRMQRRWMTTGEHDVARLAAEAPATFIAFDLLYDEFESVMDRALSERRERLEAVVRPAEGPRLAFSAGVVGGGKAFFEEARKKDLEGIMAKKLRSRYRPGRRSDAWMKIKSRKTMHCVIIGFLPEDEDVRSLVVAAPDENGALRSVGRVGSGLGAVLRKSLGKRLRERVRSAPVVQCETAPADAVWVEPELFCVVSFAEQTHGGELRHPVFEGLVDG